MFYSFYSVICNIIIITILCQTKNIYITEKINFSSTKTNYKRAYEIHNRKQRSQLLYMLTNKFTSNLFSFCSIIIR